VPELEKQRAEEKVALSFPEKDTLLHDFLLTIFVRCVTKEIKLHEGFKAAVESKISQEEISFKLRPKVAI